VIHLRLTTSGRRFFVAVMVIVAAKLILATVTPFGYDFVLYLSSIMLNDNTLAWSPWIIFVSGIYSFWLWLPIHQNDIQALVPVMLAAKPAFLVATHYLLTAMIKTPLLLCDLGTAFLVYRLGTSLSGSVVSGRRAALLWFTNPLVTLFVEMWGSIDIIIIMLSLASIVYVLRDRTRLSALTIFSAIAIRLSPILTWLSMMSWLIGRSDGSWKKLTIGISGGLGLIAYLYWSSQGQFFYNFVSFMGSTWLFSAYTPVTQTFSEFTSSELYQLFVTPGFAVMGIATYYLIAQQAFKKDYWALVAMTLSGILLAYGFADWFPTAFLWAMPLLAILNSCERKYGYTVVFYGVLAIYLATFYNSLLTSDGISVLFIPINLVPLGRILVAGIRSANVVRQVGLDFQVRSMLAGVSIAYSMLITWNILARRREN